MAKSWRMAVKKPFNERDQSNLRSVERIVL